MVDDGAESDALVSELIRLFVYALRSNSVRDPSEMA